MHCAIQHSKLTAALIQADAEEAAYDEAHAKRVEAYRLALKSADWNYEFSDDTRAWKRGFDAMRYLRSERDAAIWNSLAPAEHRVTQ